MDVEVRVLSRAQKNVRIIPDVFCCLLSLSQRGQPVGGKLRPAKTAVLPQRQA
jgi:hypothetical protein